MSTTASPTSPALALPGVAILGVATLGAALLALGGCMDTARQAPVVPQAICGTWVQVQATSDDQTRITNARHTGFITISPEHVVIAVSGLPRLVAAPVTVTMDATTSSGCVVLDDGVRIFLSGGQAMVEQPCGADSVTQSMSYLDVVTGGLGPSAGTKPPTMRLFLEQSLVCPVLHTAQGGTAAPAAPAAASPDASGAPAAVNDASSPGEQLRAQVAALNEPELRGAVQEILHAQARLAPASTLLDIVARATTRERNDLLASLMLARASLSEEHLSAAMADIARRQAALAAFDILVTNYLGRS